MNFLCIYLKFYKKKTLTGETMKVSVVKHICQRDLHDIDEYTFRLKFSKMVEEKMW